MFTSIARAPHQVQPRIRGFEVSSRKSHSWPEGGPRAASHGSAGVSCLCGHHCGRTHVWPGKHEGLHALGLRDCLQVRTPFRKDGVTNAILPHAGRRDLGEMVWLRKSCSTCSGSLTLVPCGVFPSSEEESAAISAAPEFAQLREAKCGRSRTRGTSC